MKASTWTWILCLALGACGGEETQPVAADPPTAESTDPKPADEPLPLKADANGGGFRLELIPSPHPITYGNRGIKVSVLCPQAVRTNMTAGGDGGVAGLDGMLEPAQLADTVIATLAAERFLVLPHPEVLTYMRRKTDDYDRWLGGMRRLHSQFEDIYKNREQSSD